MFESEIDVLRAPGIELLMLLSLVGYVILKMLRAVKEPNWKALFWFSLAIGVIVFLKLEGRNFHFLFILLSIIGFIYCIYKGCVAPSRYDDQSDGRSDDQGEDEYVPPPWIDGVEAQTFGATHTQKDEEPRKGSAFASPAYQKGADAVRPKEQPPTQEQGTFFASTDGKTVVRCRGCQQRLSLPSGKTLRVVCPKCGAQFQVNT